MGRMTFRKVYHIVFTDYFLQKGANECLTMVEMYIKLIQMYIKLIHDKQGQGAKILIRYG